MCPDNHDYDEYDEEELRYILAGGHCDFKVLCNTAAAKPELAPEVLKAVNLTLQNKNNVYLYLEYAYKTLGEIAIAKPEFAPEVFKSFNLALQNEKNNDDSLWSAYNALGEIAKAKPEFAPEVLQAVNSALQNENNNYDSLKRAHDALGEIAIAKPELGKNIIENIDESDFKVGKTISLYAKCLKKYDVNDIETNGNEKKALLVKAAFNMRFSTNEEIKFAADNYSLETIANMKFSAQQRCMNVLMTQLNKSETTSSNEYLNYRKDPKNNSLYGSNEDWLIPASFKAAEIFGCYFPAYIKQTEEFLSAHDAVYWLPENLSEEKAKSFASFVQRNLIYVDNNAQKLSRPLAEMSVIAQNWQSLKSDEEKLKYKDILAICKSRKYGNQEYDNFAVEAAQWGVSEELYKNYEDVYKAGLKVPEPFDSSKEFKFGKYKGRFLPRDDVRIGFFGQHTDCCQHFDAVGKACAISTIKDPYSQLFVIENEQGNIISGSWVWENTAMSALII